MKRYRILTVDFDSRAHVLTLDIKDSWEEKIKAQHAVNKAQTELGLLQEYGTINGASKIQNFIDLNVAPFSILAFHNHFFRQIRSAYIVGSYYPALTGTCALGERILNHLLLRLRIFYKSTPEYKKVHDKQSLDNWDILIDTLNAWKILQPEVVDAFRELKAIRHKAIHFTPETDQHAKAYSLTAIQTLAQIIKGQFSGFGTQPWFIENTPGITFLKKSFENVPFVKTIYIPNCALVGPYHRLEMSNGQWIVKDDFKYESKEISDEEFANLFNDKQAHPKNKKN